MKTEFSVDFFEIVSVENLLEAWQEFLRGKRQRRDVQEFSLRLMDNILALHRELVNFRYRHGGYQAFNISDPKPRRIHKASVRDRLIHHAIYRVLYPLFDRVFIANSFSCRLNKGTHRALRQFQSFCYRVSRNNTRTTWILKCDVRKFFDNINHEVLFLILEKYIKDENVIWLLREIVQSFSGTKSGNGLPLGNLTSQLLVNIYMNEFDKFAKHELKVGYYVRYSDDFVILSEQRGELEKILRRVRDFLRDKLKLELHPDKVFIKALASGMDFLGWINFTNYRVLRATTRRRMMKRILENPRTETISSYLGLLKHGNANKIRDEILKFGILAEKDV